MSDSYADELRKLADTLDEAKRELNLAREQSTKPKHLNIRARRAAVQAARAVAAAVELGFSEIWPQRLSLDRNILLALAETTMDCFFPARRF